MIWFEVEDFLRHFDHYATPTGIQRVCFEIFAAAQELLGEEERVKFCRLSMFTGRFEKVSFDAIRDAYLSRRGMDAPWSILPLPRRAWREWRAILHAAPRLPRYIFRVSAQLLGDIAKAGWRGDEEDLRPGDVIVCLGASWVTRHFWAHVARLKKNRQVRFVQLINDVIPILFPAWTPWFSARFARWLRGVAEVSDLFLTISKRSRADLERVAAAAGFALPPVSIIRWGSGFQTCPAGQTGGLDATVRSLPKRFVLCVSTFEPRKNHELLLRVWRNLMDVHGPERVPHLVLVGRVSTLVFDSRSLRSKLLSADRVNQRIVVCGHLKNAELAEAYRQSLFTVFPSFYEGWGLPVAESLAHGKFCVSSRSSSLPEVGGDWVDYFDPNDPLDAQCALERALFEPGYVEARERRIRSHYHASTWEDCTRELVAHIDRLIAAHTGHPVRGRSAMEVTSC